ncbi:MAG: DUF1343 domain-containing protein, partial [Bacteroidales bacterium]|nr:DUF1343 domain-containing protein [Bacteroidales bacterium]
MKNSLIFLSLLFACLVSVAQIVNGDERTDEYLPLLYGKKVGLVCNHTSVVGNEHLINLLLRNGVDLVKVFTPEHGLSGIAQAGERVNDSIMNVNQKELKIISLYGNHKKPYKSEISDCDVLLFDLQDVGCRFYTYISTLEYVMSSCAENDKSLILLDRPNPNNYIDGPVLEDKFKSFVGMQKIPVCYGLTIGEYATMINDENWLEGNNKCDLTVIRMLNYERNSKVILPIAPSPNLRTEQAIRNYPTLCFFEGTSISVGRGTSLPFEQIGFED